MNVVSATIWLPFFSAQSKNNVWFVGFYRFLNPPATLIEHWDGSRWSIVNSPNVGTGNNELWGISATSATDVWAVGISQAHPGASPQPLTLHWNGTQWSVVPSPGSSTHKIYP